MDNEEAQEEEVVDEIEIEIEIDTSTTTTTRPPAVTITLTTATRSRSKRPRPRPRPTTGNAGGRRGMKPATPAGESMDRPALDEDEERLVRRHREAAAFIEIEEDEEIAGVVNSSGFGPEMMEVDDREDPVDVLVDFDKQLLPVDSDFFNSFADDFDDSDLS